MLEIHERLGLHCHEPVTATVILTHEQRHKNRQRLHTEGGEEVHLIMQERGRPLLVGEYLKSRCGRIVQIQGAEETLVRATCEDWGTFARACYHLGNRHVKVQVGERWLRMPPDHVLEAMLIQQGLQVCRERAVFMPENGAYHGHHAH
ncbi:urease accessory protein UreE [Gynuella sp.]|uniref:urease accessory protein UreE n=1 Tax=Gynuella sp. TaxID=2969146 RepID=UPI003D13A290